MAIRNLRVIPIEQWGGFDSFIDPQEVPPNVWTDSLNCVVTANGNPTALRSPANFNDALSTGNKVLSAADYTRTAGGLIFFDINVTTGANVATYSTTGTTNTSRRTGQANAPWVSQNINDRLYRVNGTEFIQYVTGLTAYAVGITAPAAAPTASIVAGGSGTWATGVYVSYAYYNTVTGHIGECSAASGLSGPTSGGNNTLRTAVVASVQTGVDKIVLFVSEDGGVERFLLIDSTGAMQVFNNTTGNIDVSVATIFNNFNVQESAFNLPPTSGITHISKWKNRIMGIKGRLAYYSGFDQISIGIPQEAWPPLNVITMPSKSATGQCGIETPIGWLCLSDEDAYLLSGEPTDKVDAGENTLQITEQFDQLGWAIGTRSPKTLANTPYGSVWLDQNKHLQLWQWEGTPVPMALGAWPDLASIKFADPQTLNQAQAVWFGAGGANGGFYILTAPTVEYYSAVMALSPSLYLRFGETSGTSAADASPYGNTGTYINTPTLGVPGGILGSANTAVAFNGVDESVSVADANSLDPGNTFTVAGMIYRETSTDYYTIFDKGSNGYMFFVTAAGVLTAAKSGVANIVASTTTIPIQTWTHVAWTKAVATSALYINGVDVTGTVTNQTIVANSATLRIAQDHAGIFLNGRLDELTLFATALTAAQVAGLAAAMTAYNDRCWFVMMIQDASGLRIVPAPSSIAAQCVFTAKIGGKMRCFIGVTDRLREILDFDVAGAGWASTDRLFFDAVVGNQGANFNNLAAIRIAGANAQDAIVRVAELDGSFGETLQMELEQGDFAGRVTEGYGPRKKVTVEWPNDDAAKRDLKNSRLGVQGKRRLI